MRTGTIVLHSHVYNSPAIPVGSDWKVDGVCECGECCPQCTEERYACYACSEERWGYCSWCGDECPDCAASSIGLVCPACEQAPYVCRWCGD